MPLDAALEQNTPTSPPSSTGKTHHRTIWLSDIHLGTKGCQADYLLSFLKYNTCDTLYLVGDIIDGWQLKSKVYWPQSHTNVIRRFLTMAKRGTRIVFITGNHDEFLRKYTERRFGNIELVDEISHYTADNQKLLVVHGDQFDAVTRAHGWLSHLGSTAYDHLIELNTQYNKLRARFGLGYWSLSAFVKHRVKSAVNFISEFEHWVSRTAKQRGFDGVVCGHIHHAEIRMIDDIKYLNCGDWVESCTALIEQESGDISIVHWLEELEKRQEKVELSSDKSVDADPLELLAEFNELEIEKKVKRSEEKV